MCGRYSLTTPGDELAEVFDLEAAPELAPRYNIAPTQQVPVVRAKAMGPGRELVQLRWGLVPAWAKDLEMAARLINARAETVASKPAFRAAFKKRRCLLVADGFYEWQRLSGRKQPFHIRRKDGKPMAFAGLWESWDKGPAPLDTCTIITTTPNEVLAPIHDRMPVILDPSDFATWLDPELADLERLQSLLKPLSAPILRVVPVSARVNSPAYDDAGCVAPLSG